MSALFKKKISFCLGIIGKLDRAQYAASFQALQNERRSPECVSQIGNFRVGSFGNPFGRLFLGFLLLLLDVISEGSDVNVIVL